MKGNTRAATAIAVGYLLGRRKKLRTATLMAAGTAVGGAAAGKALRQGMKKAGSAEALGKVTPQLGEVSKTLRGELVTAGKAAATAAVNNRVDALTESIHQRAERLRTPQAAGSALRGDEDDDRDVDDEDERYEDETDELDEEDEPDDYEDDDLTDEDEGLDEEEEEEEEEESLGRRGGGAARQRRR